MLEAHRRTLDAIMAWLLAHQLEVPRPCSYLPEKRAQLEHLLLRNVEPVELDALLQRGWRRFGPDYFRPRCSDCHACVSLRIPTATFRPTRSQKKAANRCRRFRRELGRPTVDEARLSLYTAWHRGREASREWAPNTLDQKDYALTFCGEELSAREVTWWDDDTADGPKLVAVGYLDASPTALSAIYFFYAPEIAPLSPGTANVVFTLEDAEATGRSHVYLGYRVQACASLRYKSGFGPHELLHERPDFREPPRWVAGEEAPER